MKEKIWIKDIENLLKSRKILDYTDLTDAMNKEKWHHEFFDHEKNEKYISDACKLLTNKISNELTLSESEKNKKIQACENKLTKKLKDTNWLNEAFNDKATYMYNALKSCSTEGVKNPEELKHVENCLAQNNDNFLKQFWAHQAKEVLGIGIKKSYELGLKEEYDFYTRGEKEPYVLNEYYLKNNPDKIEKLKLLAAYLLSDGSVSPKRSKKYPEWEGWVITFTNKSESLLKEFKDLIKEFIPNAHFVQNPPREGTHQLIINSKDLANLLFDLTPTYSTTPLDDKEISRLEKENRLEPLVRTGELIKSNKPIKQEGRSMECVTSYFKPTTLSKIVDEKNMGEILRLYLNTEGSVHLSPKARGKIEKYVEISCLHPTLRKELIEYLNKLGINSFERGIKGCPNAIQITGLENLKKLRDKVGFNKDVKVTRKSKIWEGYNKADILNIAIIVGKLAGSKTINVSLIPNLQETLKRAVKQYTLSRDDDSKKALIEATLEICNAQTLGKPDKKQYYREKCNAFINSEFKTTEQRILELLSGGRKYTSLQISQELKMKPANIRKILRELKERRKIIDFEDVIEGEGMQNVWQLYTKQEFKDIYFNILKLIKENKGITVPQLMKELSISENALRRRLRKLEKENKIRGVSGSSIRGWYKKPKKWYIISDE